MLGIAPFLDIAFPVIYLPECALKSPPPPRYFYVLWRFLLHNVFFCFFLCLSKMSPHLKRSRAEFSKMGARTSGLSLAKMLGVCDPCLYAINRHLEPSATQTFHGVGTNAASKVSRRENSTVYYPAYLRGASLSHVQQTTPHFFVALLLRLRYGAQVEEEPYSLKLWTLMRMRPALDEQNHREGNRR